MGKSSRIGGVTKCPPWFSRYPAAPGVLEPVVIDRQQIEIASVEIPQPAGEGERGSGVEAAQPLVRVEIHRPR